MSAQFLSDEEELEAINIVGNAYDWLCERLYATQRADKRELTIYVRLPDDASPVACSELQAKALAALATRFPACAVDVRDHAELV